MWHEKIKIIVTLPQILQGTPASILCYSRAISTQSWLWMLCCPVIASGAKIRVNKRLLEEKEWKGAQALLCRQGRAFWKFSFCSGKLSFLVLVSLNICWRSGCGEVPVGVGEQNENLEVSVWVWPWQTWFGRVAISGRESKNTSMTSLWK